MTPKERARIVYTQLDDLEHQIAEAIAEAVAKERERCAKIAEEFCPDDGISQTPCAGGGPLLARKIREAESHDSNR